MTHKPVLEWANTQRRLTEVFCTCGTRLGLVPVTAGMAPVLELLRVHRAGVSRDV